MDNENYSLVGDFYGIKLLTWEEMQEVGAVGIFGKDCFLAAKNEVNYDNTANNPDAPLDGT